MDLIGRMGVRDDRTADMITTVVKISKFKKSKILIDQNRVDLNYWKKMGEMRR